MVPLKFSLWICVCVSFAKCAMISQVTTSSADFSTLSPGIQSVHPDRPEVVLLPTTGYLMFSSEGISRTTQFVIFQVHTQHVSLTLTYLSPLSDASISGNSIGMITMLNGTSSGHMKWNLTVTDESTVTDDAVAVIIYLHQYEDYVPIPGACNQVFSLETDPNIRVSSIDYKTQVWFQWANIGGTKGSTAPNCDKKQFSDRLTYSVYVQYVLENDDSTASLFNTIRSVTTVEEIKENSQLILSITDDGTTKSLVSVTSQQQQGAVYSVIVRDEGRGLEASYVSAVTYACNSTAGQCTLKYGAIEWTLVVMCCLAGLFLLILGHSWFKTEMFVFGLLATSLVCFSLMSMTALSDGVNLGVSCTVGLIGGLGWFLVWNKHSFPSVAVMIPGLTAGYLIAGVLFFTPFANIAWWASSLNYGLIFTCIALLFTVCLLFSPRLLNIVSCCLVGSYCITVAVAILLRSSLVLIVLNAIHHAKVADYASVIVISPFQVNDIILVGLWVVLLVCGMCWQYWSAWGQPHFPNQRGRGSNERACHTNPLIREGTIPPPEQRGYYPTTADESTPLLRHPEPPPTYEQSINSDSSGSHLTLNSGSREMEPPPV